MKETKLCIVSNEQTTGYTIVCAKQATKSEKFAATELQKYLALTTGVTLSVEEQSHGKFISVGNTAAFLALGVSLDEQELNGDGFIVKVVGENVYLDILAQAERYVYIFTPYLVIDAELQTALCNAAKRGVDVRIVTPGIPDKKSVFMLTRSYYPVLRRAGVKIYEYTPGFLHAKSFVCDDKIASWQP